MTKRNKNEVFIDNCIIQLFPSTRDGSNLLFLYFVFNRTIFKIVLCRCNEFKIKQQKRKHTRLYDTINSNKMIGLSHHRLDASYNRVCKRPGWFNLTLY